MVRPRLFLSALGEELLTIRPPTVSSLGRNALSIGNVTFAAWLQEQMKFCVRFMHRLDTQYDNEPLTPNFRWGNHTRFKQCHAQQSAKTSWSVDRSTNSLCAMPSVQTSCAEDDAIPHSAKCRWLHAHHRPRMRRDDCPWRGETEFPKKIRHIRSGLARLMTVALFSALVLSGGGCATDSHPSRQTAEVIRMDPARIQIHLQTTADAVHLHELLEIEQIKDWNNREQRREAVNQAHAARLTQIKELIASLTVIEKRDEMPLAFSTFMRILQEQGVDAALAHAVTQRPIIFQTARAEQQENRQHNRNDLMPLLAAADLYRIKGQDDQALDLYTEILALEPAWPEALHKALWLQLSLGDQARIRAALPDAIQAYQEAHRLAKNLTTIEPDVISWQRDVSVTLNKLGDLAKTFGQLEEAHQHFEASCAIFKKMVTSDPGNASWQRDLSISLDKLGDLAKAQGHLKEAQPYFIEALTLRKKLASSDPDNMEKQRDLSVSLGKLGDLAVTQSQPKEAYAYFKEDLAIAEKLASSDPSNAKWQRDLYISSLKLAILTDQIQTEDAKHLWRQAYDALADLDRRGVPLSPSDRKILENLRKKIGIVQ